MDIRGESNSESSKPNDKWQLVLQRLEDEAKERPQEEEEAASGPHKHTSLIIDEEKIILKEPKPCGSTSSLLAKEALQERSRTLRLKSQKASERLKMRSLSASRAFVDKPKEIEVPPQKERGCSEDRSTVIKQNTLQEKQQKRDESCESVMTVASSSGREVVKPIAGERKSRARTKKLLKSLRDKSKEKAMAAG